MRQVLVYPIQSQVDRVFALIIHAHAHQDLDAERLLPVRVGEGLFAAVHLAELVDESIGLVYLAEVGVLWGPLVVELGEVIGLDGSGVNAEGAALVVDFLLEDPGGGVDIDGRIPWPPVPLLLAGEIFIGHLSN